LFISNFYSFSFFFFKKRCKDTNFWAKNIIFASKLLIFAQNDG